MYSIWLVVAGRRYAIKRRYGYIEACRLASQATEKLERVQRAEVTDVASGTLVFKVESVKGY